MSHKYSEETLVAIVESASLFVSYPDEPLNEEQNVKTLEQLLSQVIQKMPQYQPQGCFADSVCAVPRNSQWIGGRKIDFTAAFDNTDLKRRWTLTVRYKKVKTTGVPTTQLFVEITEDSNTSPRIASHVRGCFVQLLNDSLYGIGDMDWRIKPIDSVLSPEMKQIGVLKGAVQNMDGRIQALEGQRERRTGGYNGDATSIPSTNSSFVVLEPTTTVYQCCCAMGQQSAHYRSYPGKRCNDGSYDMRTVCNRGHCKQCGGTVVERKGHPDGAACEQYHCCCHDDGDCVQWCFRRHYGTRCLDDSYNMTCAENKGRCKMCGGVVTPAPPCRIANVKCAAAPQQAACGPAFATPKAFAASAGYGCCCHEGGRDHPQFRKHKGTSCKNGTYDMRHKENKGHCKTCGGLA